MKILFVVPRFHTNQYQLVKTLLEHKHEVYFHVACLGPTEDHSLLAPVTFKQSKVSKLLERVFDKGNLRGHCFFPDIVDYWKAFRKLAPDVVVIRDPYKYFSLLAGLFALFSKAKIIFYTQEELFRTRKKKTVLKYNLTLKLFKAAWMTPTIGNKQQGNNKLRHMYYVPLPVPIKPVNQLHIGLAGEVPKILMIGKYHQDRKKHLLLIDAVNLLKDKYAFKVTFVGECVTKEQVEKYQNIEETIKRLKLSETIHLMKNVPFHKMEELYSSHHIYVLPSVNEPYGVSTIEALGYGLPVICTDTNGARFNIINGENGFVVKSSSLEELTAALETLIADKEKIKKMSQNSYAYVQQNLSGSAFYTRFLQLINDRFQLQPQ